MMSFEEFCEDCPKRRANNETGVAYCEVGGGYRCEVDVCISYHVYRKIIKTVEKLKNHCHYHTERRDGLNVTRPDRKVTFEEEG